MAVFYFYKSPVQRSKGQNAAATAAYISASKLVYRTTCQETGEEISITYDLSKKQGVVYSKIFVPKGFEEVAWLQDRAQLWNAAETREKRDDATVARSAEFSLPREVSKEENIRLVEEFVQKNIVVRGLVCDVNIHYDNADNPHVHFQFLERRLERLENGIVIFAKVKDRELISKRFLRGLRHQCEVEINKVYAEAGLPFRVTAKSFKELGLDQEPTRHKGPAHYMKATELEAKNKEIIAENASGIYESPDGRISYTKPVFTKEDIAIALSDALMVHLVSKGSDIAKEQEAIREFGKGLVREQADGGNLAQNIAKLQFGGSTHKDLLPEKWDLADRLPEGMTTSNIKEVIENVRAAHLDLNQIQNVLQSTNASDASQQLFERNIWQGVFKGKIVNEEKITSLAANEFKAATFFSSEEVGNYVKYLEATGKGSVAHDYLKYDSPTYQDILTSLAIRDERLSESIISLSNGNNTSDMSTDTETIEAKNKLIDDTQNIYKKKALEYSGIAGTNSVYRDYLELMIKNYGETHSKVTLYKNIVRDVSILHSTQLGMNIHDLPDSHHKEIAAWRS